MQMDEHSNFSILRFCYLICTRSLLMVGNEFGQEINLSIQIPTGGKFLILKLPRARRRLNWIAALILFLSSASMLAIFVILPLVFDLRIMLGPVQAATLGVVTSSALALLVLDWTQSRRESEVNKDAWLTDEHVNLMITGLEDYAIFFIDPDGTVISWNNGAAKIKGYQSDEIIGQHFSVFY